MPVGIKLSGPTFGRSLITAIPPITDLRTMVFWGTGYDGINGNRVVGGPAIIAPANAPVVSSNYATVGQVGRVATGTPLTSGGGLTGVVITDGGSLYAHKPLINIGSGANFGSGTGSIANGQVTGLESVRFPGTGWDNSSSLSIGGGNYAFYDAQVTRTSILANGYTIAAVMRGNVFGGHTFASDSKGSNLGYAMGLLQWDNDGFHGNVPTFSVQENGAQKTWVVLPNSAGWRFLAATYTGGAAGTWMCYSLTDGLSSPPSTSSGVSDAGAQQICFGPVTVDGSQPIGNAWIARHDLSFGMISGTPMTLAQLQALYASIKSILARRGVAC